MESKTTEIISSKLCPLCNEVNKFKMVNGRMSGRKCIKCISKANNQRLKEKEYYKKYYIANAEKMKANDKLRYQRTKERNIVRFTFENRTQVDENGEELAREV
jgi:hypothetical protein